MDLALHRMLGLDETDAVRAQVKALLGEARGRMDRGDRREEIEVWLRLRLSLDLEGVSEELTMRSTVAVVEGCRQ
ncbi:MAG: hypothetical protein ACR2RE_27910 [Geminicoccaceae bacterium]